MEFNAGQKLFTMSNRVAQDVVNMQTSRHYRCASVQNSGVKMVSGSLLVQNSDVIYKCRVGL